MYIIVGNFGNHSLAVMQALIEKGLSPIHFVSVDTGWSAASWAERVQQGTDYAISQGVVVHRLVPQPAFSEMVISRKQFPSPKFQWCTSFLKGLPILEYLDEHDPSCEALIVSGKRQQDSRRYNNLQEFEYQNELYQGRTLWHPLWQTKEEAFVKLIARAGFKVLPHPSLECSPCIHMALEQLNFLEPLSVKRLQMVEDRVAQTMFQQPITQLCTVSKEVKRQEDLSLQQFDSGCGAPWGCGE
ncbi:MULTISPECIES: phosphoadenosine phosphosulfate reductase family protein [unclassified Legionella]|uniref:phosphoadenosine phosphosulfate reductase domain-containing protein n=1 Tax=unclassified Legionella TaxID=2622702 RepID=UPI0010550097|nr:MULTISPECIES: phosphoadenosine phosphosulfate reductase family protein [unclassified Legionella]MDI9819124.1 phosphoadenosine phosphosulfate reductase family protein [Legionella sp. PL877]